MAKLLLIAALFPCCLLLNGCGALLVSGGAVSGYFLMKHHNNSNNYADDTLITSKVKTKLLKNKQLQPYHISVETNQGIVTLTGSLPNNQLRQEAITIAEKTKGVKRVNANNLTIYM
ncbi:MAG: BON domain-containing protein [Coxiellaceae bacterium]|nr:MAG: BON domain-containing protein [Coxiellaceae bacterium]